MSLTERLARDLKAALKSGDRFRTDVLRFITSSLHNRSIEKRSKGKEEALTDEEVLHVLGAEAKKRREAAEAFKKGDRAELAKKEEQELALIREYLPLQMSAADSERAVAAILEKSGARDFASGMKAVMAELKGKADARLVSELVRAKLGG